MEPIAVIFSRKPIVRRPRGKTRPSLVYGYLIERNYDLEHDQQDDDKFEAKRAFRVDDVRKRLRCFGDDREFTVEQPDPLLKFIFVFQTAIQPFQVRPVP